MHFIAVQFKIRKDDFKREGFRKHIEEFYTNTNPGDVIIFPEDIGLLTAFQDISAETTMDAIKILYEGKRDRIDEIMGEIPDVSFTTSIFLSLTEHFVTEFYNLFAELSNKYNVYTITCNNMAKFKSVNGSIKSVSPKIFNTAFIFNQQGKIIFEQDKVFLTEDELNLGISGGSLDAVRHFAIENRIIGVAISLDAFMPQYISKLGEADIIIQPDANPVVWNSFLENGRWQPEEWMDSSYYIAQRLPKVKFVINPMMVGNLFDINFEGQSSITKKAEKNDRLVSYIGNAPTTGFHSIIGINNYDPEEYIDRKTVAGKKLDYPEGTIEIDV